MSVIFCYKQQPQPWMYYITPEKITFSGDCCPALVTDLTHLLPFQVISQGAFQKLEYRLYGDTAWTELAITYSEVVIEGFYFISYNGSAVTELPCGVYEFRLTAGELWWFEPIMIEDFTITENALSVRDELMTPFKITEQLADTTALIAPCDMILPFMFRTENVTSGTVTVYMVDEDGTETDITITVTTGVIDGKTYYWHSEEYIYPFLACGRYYLKIVDGANTYYSVPFEPECGISDIPDGYRAMRDFNGCVMRDEAGEILTEECSAIPTPGEGMKFGLLYPWYITIDARNVAASGSHIATKTDWETLQTYLGGTLVSGGKLKDIDSTYWDAPNTGATNEVGFNARGGGLRYGNDPVPIDFYGIKGASACWIPELFSPQNPYVAYIVFDSGSLTVGQMDGTDALDVRHFGASLRSLKDSTLLTHGQTGTYTGNDGKIYRTICIGTQEWVADNLAETKYRTGEDIPEVTGIAAWAALVTGAWCYYNNDPLNM